MQAVVDELSIRYDLATLPGKEWAFEIPAVVAAVVSALRQSGMTLPAHTSLFGSVVVLIWRHLGKNGDNSCTIPWKLLAPKPSKVFSPEKPGPIPTLPGVCPTPISISRRIGECQALTEGLDDHCKEA